MEQPSKISPLQCAVEFFGDIAFRGTAIPAPPKTLAQTWQGPKCVRGSRFLLKEGRLIFTYYNARAGLTYVDSCGAG